ncbi:MAG: hypothetical protein KGL53_10785, partial [Elusimicrobia bacterium]|nr:hypothetical protein [Elusimicrobiota bacterium]
MPPPPPAMTGRLRGRTPQPAARPDADPDVERELLAVAALAPEAALARLSSGEKGLSKKAVEERRDRWGPNAVETKRRAGVFWELAERAKNPLVVQLLVIA